MYALLHRASGRNGAPAPEDLEPELRERTIRHLMLQHKLTQAEAEELYHAGTGLDRMDWAWSALRNWRIPW